ncbi:MAG: hypothetical protein DRG11_06105 [Epsilonproteobacteria bacterium]|nr:MAG: hypothetical protein DRG11_06105 [Campylobacterota bacterium]
MDIMNAPVQLHIIAVFLLFGLICFHIYKLNFSSTFLKIQKSYKITTPLFHFINAVIAYTGAIVSAYRLDISWTVMLMIIVSLFIMITEIKRYKKQRVILSTQKQLQKSFKTYATKIAISQILLLVVAYILFVIF